MRRGEGGQRRLQMRKDAGPAPGRGAGSEPEAGAWAQAVSITPGAGAPAFCRVLDPAEAGRPGS